MKRMTQKVVTNAEVGTESTILLAFFLIFQRDTEYLRGTLVEIQVDPP
jgi:hypothetical protein